MTDQRCMFRPLPGEVAERPVLAVTVDDAVHAPVYCLVDTGALHTRLPRWVADEAGVDLSDAPRATPVIAGRSYDAWFARTRLSTEFGTAECGAWFCDDWVPAFGLLGLEDFLRRYRLVVSSEERWFALAPELPHDA